MEEDVEVDFLAEVESLVRFATESCGGGANFNPPAAVVGSAGTVFFFRFLVELRCCRDDCFWLEEEEEDSERDILGPTNGGRIGCCA